MIPTGTMGITISTWPLDFSDISLSRGLFDPRFCGQCIWDTSERYQDSVMRVVGF